MGVFLHLFGLLLHFCYLLLFCLKSNTETNKLNGLFA